ncbi:lasso peptide biosynthesis B2 protein [Brevundimonas lutea]|uniref:lasso peptide biosynthesis B2 protein n=1 Tax=Brevundimonas lutea TaxID=2293980 RepID=UPI000F03E8CE|nr:lasso peptide biosynthesis B2 protein [Brevundimonas lutea]
MIAWLTAHSHMARCDDDLIVLDAARDAYLQIPDPGRALQPGAGGLLTGPEDILTALAAEGLVSRRGPAPRRPLPPQPTAPHPAIVSWRLPLDVWRVLAAVRGPVASQGDIPTVSPSRRVAAVADSARTASVIATYQGMLPFITPQGECLWRARLLGAALARSGVKADWVFGVKTWPFAAHCWLQIGPYALDDDPDRIGLYTPIMAV